MKSPAPFVGILASLLASAVAVLLASDCSAGEPVVKWRANPVLEQSRSSTNCGFQFQEPIAVEFDGKTMKTMAWRGMTYDMGLLEPLNADGSGQVYAISMPSHRSVVLKFEPGHGPRVFRYWIRYNARCIWSFVPIEG